MVDLAGQWFVANLDGRHACAMTLPGDVHSSLIDAKIISHPYIGRNEYDVRWVAEETWQAHRIFEFTGVADRGWFLDITYLDTVADIFINESLVLSASNSFRRYRPDVSNALKRGKNEIRIIFHSNIKAAAQKQIEQPFFIPYSTNNCPIPHPNMLRKAQCHFGWDWNLAIAPLGLLRRYQITPHGQGPHRACSGNAKTPGNRCG